MAHLKTRKELEPWVKKIEGKQSTKAGFWTHIDELLTFLYNNYPVEMIEHENYCKMRKDLSINKFGATKEKDERMIGSPPDRLFYLLYKIYDGLQSVPFKSQQEFWREFYRHYPQFAYAKVV